MAPTFVAGAAVTLATIGTAGSRKGIASTTRRKRSAAYSINGEWAAMLTASGITRRAPLALARVIASSRAALSPEITICPGEL